MIFACAIPGIAFEYRSLARIQPAVERAAVKIEAVFCTTSSLNQLQFILFLLGVKEPDE